MADYSYNDVLRVWQAGNELIIPIYPYIREVFINEAPLVTRLDPPKPAEGQSYNIVTYDIRPRKYTLGAAINNTASTLTLSDATPLQQGDILRLLSSDGSSFEDVQVTASAGTNNIGNNTTVNITRAMGSTTAVANDTNNNSNLTVTLIGGSGSGGDVDKVGSRAKRYQIPQYVQTFMYSVQVGGLVNAVQNLRLPAGMSNVFSLEQATKMTEMVRDMEYTMYFGRPTAPSATKNATMAGLQYLIGYYGGLGVAPTAGANTNVHTSIGGSYTLLNFTADVQKAIDGGGEPDICICSTDFVTGLQTWGFAKQQIPDAGRTQAGVPIRQIEIPFLSGPITFIPSLQMPKGNAFILTSRDVKKRAIRREFFQKRGVRGDAMEGDYIGEIGRAHV